MIVIFVHGWSVTDTNTYGRLPEALAQQASEYALEIDIKHIWLGKYISFHDEVTVTDIARAFHNALHEQIPEGGSIAQFSCITHSTGGPVVREWLDRFYGSAELSNSPISHLIMLAPANHGSPLAALGKARVGRIEAWFKGIEPGQKVLDWLSLGSQQQINLARSFLEYNPAESNFYPFVLTGQSIDKKLYDFVNSYLVEPGSDGVVRVSGANLNYSMIQLYESEQKYTVKHAENEISVQLLESDQGIQRTAQVPLGVIPRASHSGSNKGIMRSVLRPKSCKPQVSEILKCLKVNDNDSFFDRGTELELLTRNSQKGNHRYISLVFVIKDNQGDPVNDFDLFLLGGETSDPGKLSKGFFVDRQRNKINPNHLVYYVNYDIIIKNKLTGFRLIARPSEGEGFAFYHPVEYLSNGIDLNSVLKPNETFYVEIILNRYVDKNLFKFDNIGAPKLRKEGSVFKTETRYSFKNERPSRQKINE